MNTLEIMVDVIGLCAITLIIVSFISLTILYFNSQKKMTLCGLNDDSIRKDVKRILCKIRGKFSSAEQVSAYFEKRKKRNSAVCIIVWSICSVVCVATILFTVFSNLMVGSRHVWLGDTAMIIIQTDSMATANESNDYLFDENDQTNDADRILQYSFITISKNPALIDGIKQGDIVAFSMRSQDGTAEITVVHRLVNIEYNADGESLYTFRGDANPSSMAGEYQIKKDKIVGVFQTDSYQGAKSVLLGHFVAYLQSRSLP